MGSACSLCSCAVPVPCVEEQCMLLVFKSSVRSLWSQAEPVPCGLEQCLVFVLKSSACSIVFWRSSCSLWSRSVPVPRVPEHCMFHVFKSSAQSLWSRAVPDICVSSGRTSGRMAKRGQGFPGILLTTRIGQLSMYHTMCRVLNSMPYLWKASAGSQGRENCGGTREGEREE